MNLSGPWTAAKVRRLRQALRMSQQAFAQSLGYGNKSTVSLWESGKRTVTRRAYPALDLLVKSRADAESA